MTQTTFPGFLDAHVHLALIDPAVLPAGGVARVLDLGGWQPGAPAEAAELEIAYANQFLAAPGGYPGRQAWAPSGSVREVTTVTDAAAAVGEQLASGASVIKVTLNSDAGPVFATDVLRAIVAGAHENGVPVVAHAEGVGQAVRAFSAGVDMLAHTPFSERLVDELVDAMAGRMTWISTLDIHGWGEPTDDFTRASDNLRRFHAFGGRVLYGTDLGNGPLPVGLNRREIDALLGAGMAPDEVIGALTAALPGGALARTAGGAGRHPLKRVTVVPGERPTDREGFADWLCEARAVTADDLEDTD
ncbi:amidohydrolase [Glaciibacter superstes]|uniref:amidohydrolase n=1 Tax=Glaciibacter superstes TaxID=501023 RepID=UPI0003B6F34A|nr:amidohydrolase [Glaciibacter superstes]